MARLRLISTDPAPERAILVGVQRRDGTWPVDRSLNELGRLAETAGAIPVDRMIQRLDRPVPKTFIGSGKVVELKEAVARLDADLVIFDDELSPSQQGNLEKAIGGDIKIIDRTALILDIFGMRAHTSEGRIQVQLAQLQYLLPRLRGMWSHLVKEQTRGGIGSRFGQGESQLEVDRRLVRDRISSLRRDLKDLELRRDVQSKTRVESPAFRIALVGYTNAGKSTLMNQITGSSVESADKLFATLDPTTRMFRLPGGRLCTLTDTVGFIQKLPHGLVDAFRSTLAEVREADVIIEVVDASDEDRQRQMAAVDTVLDEIGAAERRRIMVFNKIDRLSDDDRADLERRHARAESVSAATGEGMEALLERLKREASALDRIVSLRIPYRESTIIRLVHEQGNVFQEHYDEDAVRITADISERIMARVEPFLEPAADHHRAREERSPSRE